MQVPLEPTLHCCCYILHGQDSWTLMWPPPRRHSLDWLFQGTEGGEGLQLLLDPSQGVGKLLVADDADSELDPLQQLPRQSLVALNDLLYLQHLIQHLHGWVRSCELGPACSNATQKCAHWEAPADREGPADLTGEQDGGCKWPLLLMVMESPTIGGSLLENSENWHLAGPGGKQGVCWTRRVSGLSQQLVC